MDDALRAFFDENDAPTHATLAAAHEALAMGVKLVSTIEHQVARYHELRRAAIFANKDHSPTNLMPTIENIRPLIDDVGKGAQSFLEAAETLSERMQQLDRAMQGRRKDIERHDAAMALQKPPAVDSAGGAL